MKKLPSNSFLLRGYQTARGVAGGFVVACTIVMIAACAPLQSERLLATAAAFPAPIELDNVPFFPQEEFQYGPAALATVLAWSGVAVTPEQVAPQNYIPERQDNLQLDLLNAARHHGRIPYVLRPQLESLAAELASGNPVLVLQNLDFATASTAQYAVVVGLDLGHGEITLRSGNEKRYVIALSAFEHRWQRAGYWAVVVLPPDQLPFTAEEVPYLQSVAATEQIGANDTLAQAYTAALKRWPQSSLAFVGLGNARYALGDMAGAEKAFRRALEFGANGSLADQIRQTLNDITRKRAAP